MKVQARLEVPLGKFFNHDNSPNYIWRQKKSVCGGLTSFSAHRTEPALLHVSLLF